jgi:WD40 repeat protein
LNGIAFSPDGATLASAGRAVVKLWDVASGHLLLDLAAINWLTDVAFAPDGRRLAAGGRAAQGSPGLTAVWELENGRGIQTLRGLTSQIEKVLLSPDERFLAAVGHDSRVAVWDRQSGELLHVFEAPKTLWVDNAALAFSPEGRRLAFAGSSATAGRAKLWDLGTGQELGSWSFSPGHNNVLAFHPSGKLILAQIEPRSGKRLMDENWHPRSDPPVLRVRDLSGETPKQLCEVTQFDLYIDWPCAPVDGRFFAVIGYGSQGGLPRRQTLVFDGLTGKELWSSPPEREGLRDWDQRLTMDHTGTFLTITRAHRAGSEPLQIASVEISTGRYLSRPMPADCPHTPWSPDMPYWIHFNMHPGKLSLVRRGEQDAAVVLGIDVQGSGSGQWFNRAGTRYAWGNGDGTVNVCDIPAVQRRLGEIGLGWGP